MTLSAVPEQAPEVGTVPDGVQVVGRYAGVTEGQYPKIRITWEGQDRDGGPAERFQEVELPNRYDRSLFEALDGLGEGQRVALSVSPFPRQFVYKNDGQAGGRSWRKGDHGALVILVVRSVVVLDG